MGVSNLTSCAAFSTLPFVFSLSETYFFRALITAFSFVFGITEEERAVFSLVFGADTDGFCLIDVYKRQDMATKLGASYVVPTGHYEFPEISDNLNSTSFTLYKLSLIHI